MILILKNPKGVELGWSWAEKGWGMFNVIPRFLFSKKIAEMHSNGRLHDSHRKWDSSATESDSEPDSEPEVNHSIELIY